MEGVFFVLVLLLCLSLYAVTVWGMCKCSLWTRFSLFAVAGISISAASFGVGTSVGQSAERASFVNTYVRGLYGPIRTMLKEADQGHHETVQANLKILYENLDAIGRDDRQKFDSMLEKLDYTLDDSGKTHQVPEKGIKGK